MDQETNLKINVESGSLKDLNQQLKEVSEKWQSVKVGTEAYKAFYKQVQALQKSIKAAGAEIDVNGNLISKLKTNIFSLVPGLSSVQDGFTALNTTMLEVAANPVLGTLVAIVAQLTITILTLTILTVTILTFLLLGGTLVVLVLLLLQ